MVCNDTLTLTFTRYSEDEEYGHMQSYRSYHSYDSNGGVDIGDGRLPKRFKAPVHSLQPEP